MSTRFEVMIEGTTRHFHFRSLAGARSFSEQHPGRTTIFDLELDAYVHDAPDESELLDILRRANEIGGPPLEAMRASYAEWLRIPPLCRS